MADAPRKDIRLYQRSSQSEWRNRDYGGYREVSDYWTTQLARDPECKNIFMTCELVFGTNTRVRIATQPFSTTSGVDSVEYGYSPLLMEEPEISHTYTFGSATSSARSFPLSLLSERVQPQRLIRQGQMLAGFGEISLQVKDGDYDKRLVLMRGDMTGGVVFGADREILETELVDPKESEQIKVFDVTVQSPEPFSDPHESAIGERYPWVGGGGFQYIPCPRVSDSTSVPQFLVSGNPAGLTVSTSAGVYVNGANKTSGDGSYPWSVSIESDSQGQPVMLVNFSAGATWEDADTVHVIVTPEDTDDPQDGVIEVARKLVAGFTNMGEAGIHDQLFSVAQAKLAGADNVEVLVNGSGRGADGTALEVIEGELSNGFPMLSWVWEGGRYGPIITDRMAPPVAKFIVGQAPILDRASAVRETSKNELFNSFTIRYKYNLLLDQFEGLQERNPTNSGLCQASASQIGHRHHPVIESVYIQDDATAAAAVEWLVAHRALPSYLVTYDALPEAFFRLKRGDTVELTDSEFNWSEQAATVESLTYKRGRASVQFRVWVRYHQVGGNAR